MDLMLYPSNNQVNGGILFLSDPFFLISFPSAPRSSLDNCFIIHSAVPFSHSLNESP